MESRQSKTSGHSFCIIIPNHLLRLFQYLPLILVFNLLYSLIDRKPPTVIHLFVMPTYIPSSILHEEEIDYLEYPVSYIGVLVGVKIFDVVYFLYYLPVEPSLFLYLPVGSSCNILPLLNQPLWKAPDSAALNRDQGNLDSIFALTVDDAAG